MSNAQIIEGTGKEIGAVLLGEPFASLRLRVYVDQDAEEDLVSDVPSPPFTVRDEAHLKELLLDSLQSPTHPVTEETWKQLHRRIDVRMAGRGITVA